MCKTSCNPKGFFFPWDNKNETKENCAKMREKTKFDLFSEN